MIALSSSASITSLSSQPLRQPIEDFAVVAEDLSSPLIKLGTSSETWSCEGIVPGKAGKEEVWASDPGRRVEARGAEEGEAWLYFGSL